MSEYGGQMTVHSKNNQGSNFGFSFKAVEFIEEATEAHNEDLMVTFRGKETEIMSNEE